MTYPHRAAIPGGNFCRCGAYGARRLSEWGSDCPAAMRDEIERLGAILTAERTDRDAAYERGKRDGDAEMMREVVRLRAERDAAHEAGVRDGLAAARDAVSTCCEAAYDAVSKIDPAAVRTTPTPKPTETGDCRTCAHDSFGKCGRPIDAVDHEVNNWINHHLDDDAMTRKPGSPPCPGSRAKETT